MPRTGGPDPKLRLRLLQTRPAVARLDRTTDNRSLDDEPKPNPVRPVKTGPSWPSDWSATASARVDLNAKKTHREFKVLDLFDLRHDVLACQIVAASMCRGIALSRPARTRCGGQTMMGASLPRSDIESLTPSAPAARRDRPLSVVMASDASATPSRRVRERDREAPALDAFAAWEP